MIDVCQRPLVHVSVCLCVCFHSCINFKKTMTFTLTAMFFYVAYHLTLPYKNILSISHQPCEQKCMSGRKLNVGCYPSCLPVVVSASMIWTDASVFKMMWTDASVCTMGAVSRKSRNFPAFRTALPALVLRECTLWPCRVWMSPLNLAIEKNRHGYHDNDTSQ